MNAGLQDLVDQALASKGKLPNEPEWPITARQVRAVLQLMLEASELVEAVRPAEGEWASVPYVITQAKQTSVMAKFALSLEPSDGALDGLFLSGGGALRARVGRAALALLRLCKERGWKLEEIVTEAL